MNTAYAGFRRLYGRTCTGTARKQPWISRGVPELGVTGPQGRRQAGHDHLRPDSDPRVGAGPSGAGGGATGAVHGHTLRSGGRCRCATRGEPNRSLRLHHRVHHPPLGSGIRGEQESIARGHVRHGAQLVATSQAADAANGEPAIPGPHDTSGDTSRACGERLAGTRNGTGSPKSSHRSLVAACVFTDNRPSAKSLTFRTFRIGGPSVIDANSRTFRIGG